MTLLRPILPGVIFAALLLSSLPAQARAAGEMIREVSLAKVSVKPGEPNELIVALDGESLPAGTTLHVEVRNPWGQVLHEVYVPGQAPNTRIPIPPAKQEGGYLVQATLLSGKTTLDRGSTIHSVVRNIADDLRYGFYAKYSMAQGGEEAYRKKTDLLANIYINAVEYYDYFSQHGKYALREDTRESVKDVAAKLAAGHERNIRGIAYIAAYAADPLIYKEYPFAMTDEKGVPRMFSDLELTTEDKVIAKHGKPTGLYLTAVADDTPWYAYIMKELKDVVAHPQNNTLSFDGFEIDTYGDAKDSKFFAKDSKYSGQLLSKVLKKFVEDVRDMTHAANPNGLVSFNCVSEFGIEEMYDVTDFLFIELWHWRPEHSTYQALVDTAYRHRAFRNQRVIIKIYPADMKEKQPLFPPRNLRLALGAIMTGAGSLMIAGEPQESIGRLQALSTMIYQQCVPMNAQLEKIVRDYYRFDALYYGYTHGRHVTNEDGYKISLPGCIIKSYNIPEHRMQAVQLLHTGPNTGWGFTAQPFEPHRNQKITLPLPPGKKIARVTYASPDAPELLLAKDLDYKVYDGKLEAILPELSIYGVIFLHYAL